MRLIKLTHSVTEKGIYVDFDKVIDVIFVERKGYTIIWQDTHTITVKESPEQIATKLAKKTKKEMQSWN